MPGQRIAPPDLAGLVDAYLAHARVYYAGSREARNLAATLGRLARSRGGVPVDGFRARELKAWRAELVAEGLSRGYCNRAAKHARRMMRWAVEEELAAPETLASLKAVSPLKKGRTAAADPEPVGPVPLDDVLATLPLLAPGVRAVVEILRLTGARTGEIRTMRTADLDTERADVWWYRPRTHKTAHHGKARAIPLDAPCIAVIMDHWLPLLPEAFVFRSPRTDRAYGESSIGQAVRNAAERAGVPLWHPHQLRHAYLDTVRTASGGDPELARAAGGHAHIRTTELYAKADEAKSLEAMRAVRNSEGGAP